LKADPALSDIPVIAFTSNSLPTDRERALEAGCDDHDTKPLDIERLTSKINRLLPMG
jgi:CheY-like chemotaxis protein